MVGKNQNFKITFYIKKRKMQLNVLKYNWLLTNVPHISFLSQYDWQRWLRTLTQYERMNFCMNISGIEQYRNMIEDDFDKHAPETDEFEDLLVIHMRLVELLFVIKN